MSPTSPADSAALRDPMSGRMIAPGWAESGLPVDTASPPGMSYDDLRRPRRHPVIARPFHAWERRLASVDTNRVVRPFEWGLDWMELDQTPAIPSSAHQGLDGARHGVERRVLHGAADPDFERERRPCFASPAR